jgi:ADP-heptose:LPS heptosyltransferase
MQKLAKRTLIVSRFSAFGDVVIARKVIRAVVKQNPDCDIVFLTKQPFTFLFDDIERVRVFVPELKGRHKGIMGLRLLSRELKAFSPEAYLDIHNVLRTVILRFFLFTQGIQNKSLRKGRWDKYRLTRKNRKVFKSLKNSAERYADVFRAYGLKVDLADIPENPNYTLSQTVTDKLPEKRETWIGIAPFSLHKQKIYPAEKMHSFIKLMSENGYRVFIFGGGKAEKRQAEEMIAGIPKTEVLIGRFSMKDELALIAAMDLMLTMDSGNMHLASLANTKLLVVWGGTHPYAGFAPYKNPNYRAIQIPHSELPCRPCSVYGKKPCYRGDWACLNRISPEAVAVQVEDILNNNS